MDYKGKRISMAENEARVQSNPSYRTWRKLQDSRRERRRKWENQ